MNLTRIKRENEKVNIVSLFKILIHESSRQKLNLKVNNFIRISWALILKKRNPKILTFAASKKSRRI
jgi:hypothetical protein